jgi:hypothetical protein
MCRNMSRRGKEYWGLLNILTKTLHGYICVGHKVGHGAMRCVFLLEIIRAGTGARISVELKRVFQGAVYEDLESEIG